MVCPGGCSATTTVRPAPGRSITPWLVLVALSAQPLVAATRAFEVRPPRRWIEPVQAVSAEAARPESPGTRQLLIDEQVRATRDSDERYVHVVWKVETTAGLQDASEISLDFSPSFERLAIHHARLLRGAREAWRFAPAEVRVSPSADDAESRLYDDTLTATIFVKGLQVGDTIDYAYSLEGRNPVLGGHFDKVFWLEGASAIDHLRRRLVWQRPGAPHFARQRSAPAPVVSSRPGETSYEWDLHGTKPRPSEDRTPSWYEPAARIEVSDFDDWPDVARRARELFASVDRPAPSLDTTVAAWRRFSEEERIEQAVRFVQDDVRYLGLEMGRHSHEPHRPEETLERRFGDCKDKSALLTALLRRLGVRAWPALVSTDALQALDERLPSLFSFDHVIVALEQGGALRFVDATASQQGGRVPDRRPPPYARALVLDPGRRGLVSIPQPTPRQPSTAVTETFALRRWGGPARLDVVTVYREEDADDARQSQARSTRAETGKQYRDFYAREHGEVRALGEPRVEDDRDGNVVVVREAYELPRFSAEDAHDFRAWLVDGRLARPKTLERRTPVAVHHPAHLRQTLVVRLPGPPEVEALSETVKSPAFALDVAWQVRGHEARLDYTYRSLAASVEPGAMPELLRQIERATDLTACRIRTAATPGAAKVEGAGWFVTALAAGGVLVVVGWAVHGAASSLRLRRRRTAFRSSQQPRAGERPDTAIAVSAEAAISGEALRGFCECGGAWRELDRASLVYDGLRLCVLTRRCDRCGIEATLYFSTPR